MTYWDAIPRESWLEVADKVHPFSKGARVDVQRIRFDGFLRFVEDVLRVGVRIIREKAVVPVHDVVYLVTRAFGRHDDSLYTRDDFLVEVVWLEVPRSDRFDRRHPVETVLLPEVCEEVIWGADLKGYHGRALVSNFK